MHYDKYVCQINGISFHNCMPFIHNSCHLFISFSNTISKRYVCVEPLCAKRYFPIAGAKTPLLGNFYDFFHFLEMGEFPVSFQIPLSF